MRILHATNRKALEQLIAGDEARRPSVERRAARIVSDVRRKGDAAVLAWSRRLQPTAVPVTWRGRLRPLTSHQLKTGWRETPREVRAAIKVAVRNARKVAERQVPRPFAVTVRRGVTVRQRVAPLARVGCYVPGGRYPLPSTLVMTAVPAIVAGVKDVIVTCPNPAAPVLAAALEAGVSQVFAIGGAQAIGAMAYGTESIARVDKIVGPGNAWVTAAKSLVAPDCAIDFHAGPSEIVVLSDTGRAEWIAADLLAQAEHDPAARAVFVTTRRRLADAVRAEVEAQLRTNEAAREAIDRNGAIVVARTRRTAIEVVNAFAPEHLVCDRPSDVPKLDAAGTIFVGEWSAQASGDYCTGSNHVLPTGGAARFRGGLSAADFVRTYTVQTLTRRGLEAIGPSVVALAEAEGLAAHADSIRLRLTGSVPDRRKAGPTRLKGSVPNRRKAGLTPGTRQNQP